MILKITDLNSGYGKVPILDNVSLEISKHEVVTVIGPNGAGKSTLMKTITGLVKATSGSVEMNGENLVGLSPDMVMRKGISLVPEGGRVFPNLTVLDNLRMGAYTTRDNLKSGIVDEIYTLFPRIKDRAKQYARSLSGGERQMLAIARGLVSRPQVLMLDEPSLGLAPKLVDEIYENIYKLKEGGLTVLLVEQNTTYALELGDRGYVLENGRITLSGTCKELADSPHVKKAYLGL
jgi:branched-chain amino acid transport system ATP-binding protein